MLGVEADAPPHKIRRRYRDLLLRHHPDRAKDAPHAHEATLRIVWAYQVLTDPRRREQYLRAARNGAHAVARQVAEDVVARAETHVLRAEWPAARDLLKPHVRDHPSDARALHVLAEAYAGLGDVDRAVSLLTLALQLEPTNVLFADRLETLARKSVPQPDRRQQAPSRPSPPLLAARLASAVAGPALLWIVVHFWPEPGPLGAPKGALLGLPLTACVAGLLMAATGLLGRSEQELLDAPVGRQGRAPGPPLLVWLLALGVVSLYLALLGYVIIAAVEGAWSRSVLVVLGCALILAGEAALLAPHRWQLALSFGANAALISMLVGWTGGRLLQRAW